MVIAFLLLFLNLLFGGCKTVHSDTSQEGFGSDKFKPFFFIHAGDPQIGMAARLGLGSIEEDKDRFIQLAKRVNELDCLRNFQPCFTEDRGSCNVCGPHASSK